jgi:hypothetical protein
MNERSFIYAAQYMSLLEKPLWKDYARPRPMEEDRPLAQQG